MVPRRAPRLSWWLVASALGATTALVATAALTRAPGSPLGAIAPLTTASAVLSVLASGSLAWLARRAHLAQARARAQLVALEHALAQRRQWLLALDHELVALRAALGDPPGEVPGTGLYDDARATLARARGAAARMNQLLDALLERPGGVRPQLGADQVDLSRLASQLIARLRQRTPGRRVDVVLAPGLLVRGDERLLRLALGHLLDHAWEATVDTPEPRIELVAERRDGERVLLVRDNGRGFELAEAPRVLARPELAMARRVIARHGGRLWVDAAAPGQGAALAFTVESSGF